MAIEDLDADEATLREKGSEPGTAVPDQGIVVIFLLPELHTERVATPVSESIEFLCLPPVLGTISARHRDENNRLSVRCSR